ncbi:MAG TPA: vWA domain-containing protein [Bacteroidota bacterium]|nr:vWA domain-containing protein [Bacteroidota bacterium]
MFVPRGLSYLLAALALVGTLQVGCKKDDSPNASNLNADIPPDPGGSAPATTINNVVPSASFARTPGNESRIRINLLGLTDPTNGQPINYVANQTVFVTEDGVLKGIRISSAGGTTTLTADVVFTVDNSGSMGEEADSIASKIIEFVNYLQASGLDLRVGVVGYNGRVTGAMNLTTGSALNSYLTRTGFIGTSRTVGFGGSDSARLESVAATFASGVGGENGVVGVWFADSLFSWRAGAQRVYVNFTDEPTQPNNLVYWSTEGLCARWTPTKGTIHTVYSADTARTWTRLIAERPWDLSACTGGTSKFLPSNAAGLDLRNLPVTGALASSRLVEFLSANPSIPHTVVITIKTQTADGKTTFTNITY